MKKTQDQNPKSMINQKTNQDFNNAKPDPKSPNFKEKKAVTESESPSPVKSYTCSMHPEIISDNSGRCPKCGMIMIERTDVFY